MKHEQITLVALGYIIGFVTAFIGFALTDTKETHIIADNNMAANQGLVANAANDASSEQVQKITAVTINNDGLFAKIGPYERIVSAASFNINEQPAGYHYAISKTLISPDSMNLYYCAQTSPDSSDCKNYIYKASTDTIYLVKDTNLDQYLTSDVAALSASWSEDGLLTINGQTSTSAESPWMMR